MVDLLAEESDGRGWSELMLKAPRANESGRRLYERIAEQADWSSFVIRFSDR